MPDPKKMTDEELLQRINKLQLVTSPQGGIQREPATRENVTVPPVPGFEQRSAEVERDITGRQDMLRPALEEERQVKEDVARGEISAFRGALGAPLREVKKGLGVLERAHAVVGNTLLEIQKGERGRRDVAQSLREQGKIGSLEMVKHDLEVFKNIGKAVKKGITGERLGRISDVPIKAGFGKIPSMFIEVGVSAALTGGLSPKTTAGKTLKGVEKGVKKAVPRWMGKDFTYNQAVQASDEIDSVRRALGTAVGQSVDNVATGAKTVNVANLVDDFANLTDDVVGQIKNPLYDIKFLADDITLDPSVSNMWKVNQMLDDFMTSKTWHEAPKIKQRLIKNIYLKISNEMKRAAPEIKAPFKAYSNYMDDYRLVERSLRSPQGVILEKRAEAALKPGRPRSVQKAWENISRGSNKVKRAKRAIEAFNRRQVQKKAVKSIGLAAGRGGLIAGAGAAGVAGGLAATKALVGE